MGEDPQTDDADEGYGLSPALDDSEKLDELEGIICSVDGVSIITHMYLQLQ